MIIAKQMDVRSNIKKYFDIAYEGEAVVVPRKEDRNVVIISEAEYNRLNLANRLASYENALSPLMKKKEIDSDSLKKHNMEKIKTIRSMKKNWNGNGAPAFKKELIEKVSQILDDLMIQPEIFPTALGTIQLEYDNSRKDHMEIEIGESETAEIFIVKFNGEELYEEIQTDANEINKRMGSFYG